MPIAKIELTDRFKRDFKRLDPALQLRVETILTEQLIPWPTRGTLRHHTLSGIKPPVHVLDVVGNHSHQITFQLDGDVAKLLRVGTHREIDRRPT